MSINYVLENAQESERLERQTLQPAYNLAEELQGLEFKRGDRVLDAGCGTGLVARTIAQSNSECFVDGCDFSLERLAAAKQAASQLNLKNVNFFQSNLCSIDAKSSTYDAVTCRYVMEHVDEPGVITKELYRVIKPKGFLYVINFDGLIYNLYPMSSELRDLTQEMLAKGKFDLYAGRKIPSILIETGFDKVAWKISAHGFQGEDLKIETQMNEERIQFAIPMLADIFGSELKAYRFKKLFIEESLKPGAVLFYNKFIVVAKK